MTLTGENQNVVFTGDVDLDVWYGDLPGEPGDAGWKEKYDTLVAGLRELVDNLA